MYKIEAPATDFRPGPVRERCFRVHEESKGARHGPRDLTARKRARTGPGNPISRYSYLFGRQPGIIELVKDKKECRIIIILWRESATTLAGRGARLRHGGS